MNFSTLAEDEDEDEDDDEKVIPKTASSGRGQKNRQWLAGVLK